MDPKELLYDLQKKKTAFTQPKFQKKPIARLLQEDPGFQKEAPKRFIRK